MAAFTVPSVIANSRRAEISAKLKKFYSTLNQAAMRSKALGNDWEDWAADDDAQEDYTYATVEKFTKDYLLPHINYTQAYPSAGRDYSIYLADGSFFMITKGPCLGFHYDVNGFKKPNEYGRDLFRFLYCPYSYPYLMDTGRVIPFLDKNETREGALERCKNDNATCSGLLAIDSWEFKKDYPYRI